MKGFGLVVVIWIASGCIQSNLVDCGDGRACPVGTVCAKLIETADELCAGVDELDECDGLEALASCDARDGEVGACYASDAGLVCLESGCGNALLDVAEVCDDGNAITGDGCSVSCSSNETCGNGIVDPLKVGATDINEQCDDHNRSGYDGCASDCRTEAAQWSLLAAAIPEPRFATAVAYDSGRDRIVMFGGAFQAGLGGVVTKGDTWEWNGVAWLKIPTLVGPSARGGHVAVYDVARRRVVMFAGTNAGFLFDDMWEWDGSTWTQIATGTPIKRTDASAVYDPVRKRIVIFGGRDGPGFLGDTWEWDGTAWTQRMISGPSGRASAGLVFDSTRGVIMMLGGFNASGTTTDVWEYDGTSWTSRPGVTPSELSESAFAFDGSGVLAFGGQLGSATTGNTWRYNGTTWTQLTPTDVPTARRAGRMVRDPIRNRIILFGGHSYTATPQSANTHGDPRAWDGTTWIPITLVESPAPRSHHAMTYDSLRGRIVVVGGTGQILGVNPSFGDTWELDGHNWYRAAQSQPSARSSAALAYDPLRRQTVLFGGQSQSSVPLGDTQIWDGATWTPVAVGSSPPARHSHAMGFDPVRGTIVMHGGSTNNAILDDTWEWNGTAWSQLTVQPKPTARYGHAIVHDPLRRRMRLFGGQGSSTSFADLWEWDGSWSNVTPADTAPPPRRMFAMVWNGVRRRMLMFGGQSGTFSFYDDVWELTDVWSQLFTPNPPSQRGGVSAAQLPDGTGVMVFGGVTIATVLSNEVFRLRWENTGSREICTLDVDDDNDGLAGCADPDCWAKCTPLCPPGATCDPSWPKCGDGNCNAPIESPRSCPTDCAPTSPVCGDNFCDPGETLATCKGDCS